MVETKTQIIRFLGFFLLLVGIGGLIYLGWVYVVWGKALPRLDEQAFAPPQSRPSLGFGDLLKENPVHSEGLESVDLSAVDSTSNEIEIGQNAVVLADKSQDAVDVGPSLSVPRLGIEKAKLEFDVDGDDERIYDTVLTRSVAHLRNSAYPGEFGNVFLFGHSKLPILAGTDYESIFTDLPKVKVGDVVRVQYQGAEYTYQITQTGVVDPDDTFVMNQPATKKMITLMTCIPPGFANQRYITVGELIDVRG